MPIFQGFFVVSWPSGLGVGFVVSTLRVRTLDNVLFVKIFDPVSIETKVDMFKS